MKTYTESRKVHAILVSQGWKTTGIIRYKNKIAFYLRPPKGMLYKESASIIRWAKEIEREEKKWQV